MGRLKSFRTLLLTFPRRWLARKVAVNIAPTKHVGRRVDLPRTRFVPHGVPEYPTKSASSSHSENADLPYFAYVGRLVAEKGVPVLLKACSLLGKRGMSFRLKIVGDGTERRRLEALASSLGLGAQVEFLGSTAVENIPDLLRDAVAVVMPSIWEDVAPLVAYEQLMHGHLVIASDLGGLGEIVDDVGLKFPPGDARGFGCLHVACIGRAKSRKRFAKKGAGTRA